MHAARRGDEQAFTALYARLAPYVHAIALAGAAPVHAPDIVQDTFVKAWRRLDDLREPQAVAAWIGAIARRRAADVSRSVRVEPIEQDVPGPPPALDAALDADRVLQVIASLPEAYRETLVLRLVEGCTGPEIAALTGLSPGSVRVNLHRGMRLLRAALGIATRDTANTEAAR